MKSNRSNIFLAISAIACSLISSVYAVNYQWDVNGSASGLGGAGTWNTANAFWDNTASGVNDGTDTTTAPTFTGSDTAIFGGTAGNVTVDAVTVGGLNFTSSGYNLSGGTISLGANTTILQTTSPSSNTTTISSKISGAFKLTLNATSYAQYANLTLSGANDYSGGTDLNHNTIVTIGNATAFGAGTVTVNGFFGQLRASSALTIANNIVLNNNWGLFGDHNVTTSGTLNLGGGAPRTIEVASGRTFAISGNTSNGALTKTGAGILRLNNSSYAGATIVSNGTLRLRNSSSSSGFSVASGANLELTNLTLSSTQNITGAGNVSTDVSVFGSATLNGNNNNYTGATTVAIDRFRLGTGGVINGTNSITVQGQWSSRFENFGTATTSGALSVNGYAGSGSDTESGIFYNGNTAGTTPGTLSAASITLGNSFRSSATGKAKGGEFFNYANSTVNLGSGAITVNGQGNSLAGGMTVAGSTFTNAGSVSAGSITLNSSSTANTASNKGGTYTQTAGSTTLSGSATLAANGGVGAAGTAGNDAAFNLSGGTFSANSIAVNSGTLTATGGTITLGSGGITKSGSAITAVNLGATTLSASAAWNSSVNMSLTDASTGTTINTSGGNISLSGQLSGSGSLVKNGTGILTLSNSNNYSGTTTIAAGTLRLDGSGSISDSSTIIVGNTLGSSSVLDVTTKIGGFTISSTQSLQGSGSINGAVTVAGTLSPGNSIESLGSGAVTFNSGSTLNYELDTSNVTADLLYSSGLLAITNGTNLLLGDIGLDEVLAFNTKFTLISYFDAAENWSGGLFTYNADTLTDGEIFTLGANEWRFDYNDTSGGNNFSFEQSGASRFVTMTVIPEPSTALLGTLGLLALVRRRRS